MDTNKELIEQVTAKAQAWLTDGYDAETQAEVRACLNLPTRQTLSNLSTKTSNSEPAASVA